MQKSIQIFKTQEETTVSVTFEGRQFKKFTNHPITSVAKLSNFIHDVHATSICPGVSNFMDISAECKTGVKIGTKWFSKSCHMESGEPGQCQPCSKLRANLATCRYRLRIKLSTVHRLYTSPTLPKHAKAYVKSLRRRIAQRTNQLRRCQRGSVLTRMTMSLLNKQMKKVQQSTLLEGIDSSDLPNNMKESMRNAMKNAKRKSAKGNRFEAGWLLQCLLLRIKSPKAYCHLRNNNVLPLPHPRTLQRLVAGIPCEFGFTGFAFDHLKIFFSKKKKIECERIVMFEEIKVREEVNYDKIKMEFNGFVDNGCETEKPAVNTQLADHALVFMYKSHYGKVIQPLGSFATRGAASGEILAKLLISCVVRLEAANARISAVVSDGATTNKNMWKLLGVSGKLTNFSNWTVHPCQIGFERKRKLFFCSDVPHLIKCIRNHFFKHKAVVFNGTPIDSGFYQAVYDLDQKLPKGLRNVPKLTEAHLKPNSFQKMRVYLATQVFSKTMADAMCFYRHQKEPFMQGSKSTEIFTRSINDLFDALNASHTAAGIRLNSKGYSVIDSFKTNLFQRDELQTFCSSVTLESLPVTLQSFLDVINYLLKEVGFNYILTGKINQDSLERFFGILRQVAGDEDHPTIISFIHLYRLLCLYTPTSRLKNGNVSSGDDNPVAVSSYAAVLLKSQKRNKTENLLKRLVADDKILKSILSTQAITNVDDNHLLEHNYFKKDPSTFVIYQLCGYIAHRVQTGNQFTSCLNCKQSVSSFEESSAKEASLTRIKSLGALQYPTKALYNLIYCHVEPHVSDKLKRLHSVVATEILDSLSGIPCLRVGCGVEEHNQSLSIRVISFYITIRMYFFARTFNSEIITSRAKAKQQRKLAKLT